MQSSSDSTLNPALNWTLAQRLISASDLQRRLTADRFHFILHLAVCLSTSRHISDWTDVTDVTPSPAVSGAANEGYLKVRMVS